MHLLLVAGFLGSGKTSLILSLARFAAGRNCKIAIIVNEIGEIGVDDQLMRQLDLNVWELLNGCICCTLAGDLATTLQQLDSGYCPDLVIVETSGAANPLNVLAALDYYQGRSLQSILRVTLVDPLRLPILMEVLTPLITAQIEQADVALISKPDLASSAEVQQSRLCLAQLNPARGWLWQR